MRAPRDESTSSPKRVKTEMGAALDDFQHSLEFWYPDGNVIIEVEDTGFKLFASRLSRHCQYFSGLLHPDGLAGAAPRDRDCEPNLAVPADSSRRNRRHTEQIYTVNCVTAHQFEVLLKFLDMPFQHSIQSAPHDMIVALYRASEALGCPQAHAHALERIKHLWDSADPPDPSQPALCEYEDALQVIALARQHDIPAVLKRAFYEVLRSARFWALVDSRGHRAVALSRTDLLALYTARVALVSAWRALCAEPPRASAERCKCSVKEDAGARARAWQGALSEAALVDLDPLLYATQLRKQFVPTGGDWCDRCLRRRSTRWKAARVQWWSQLDVWLGLRAPAQDRETEQE